MILEEGMECSKNLEGTRLGSINWPTYFAGDFKQVLSVALQLGQMLLTTTVVNL